MESEKRILSSELETFVKSVKTIIKEQLEEGFNREINVYKSFLKSFNQAFAFYFLTFNEYKENPHASKFLFKNIQLNNQLKEALEVSFKRNEPMYLTQSFQNLNWQMLDLFSDLFQDNGSSFFQHIQKIEEEQFNRKPYLTRKFVRLTSTFHKNNTKTQEESIHSFLYFFYKQTIGSVLEENKEKLFDFHQQLANLATDFWSAFLNNTAFMRSLHDANYVFESLAATDLNWNLDNLPEGNYKKIENAFKDFCTNISSEAEDKIVNFNFSSFLEQKKKFLALNEIKSEIQKDVQKSEKSEALWRTTRFAFTEDFCLDLEIYSLRYQIVQKTLDFIQTVDTSFNQPFYRNLHEFESQFDHILEYLNKDVSKKFEKNPDETLKKFKLQLKKELLVKSLPQIRKHLNSSEIIKEIDDFETMTSKSFTLSQTRVLMKKPDYTRKVNPDELESISPNDLISFEIKPTFTKVFPAFKQAIIEHTQNVLNELETAPSVTIFSIESASQYFKEQKNPEEVINICVEGVKRSKTKLKEAGVQNQKFFETEKEKFRNAIEILIASVTEITDKESAFQIKIRIVKAKAIARSKELRKLLISKVLSFLPKLIESFINVRTLATDAFRKINKHFVNEKSRGFIATDISDYLTNTQSTISKLPYIYQRLFSFEPLETFELYVERKAIMDKMELAFSKWKEEKFAPVIVVGEKGSGKTTFVRKFIKAKVKNENVYEIDLLSNNISPMELYNKILEQTHLIEPVQGEKRIIFLDGLERLYEAKINGFEFLLKLFKIISDTQKDVFWIVSAHSISWNFFDKSIDASNYFGYHIYLNDLDFEELYKLIENRHKLSGYPLLFGETQRKKSILGNKPSNSAEQQKLFKKDYFNELNKSVQGNILQTFIYWMCSASLTENKTIYIESENSLDFNFVRSIHVEKLILLRNILVHNGLDVNRLAKIARVDKSQMELQVQQFLDDGILTFSNNVYFVTPLIYKQVIKHLTDLNLIH